MKVERTSIADVLVLEPKVFSDARGYFYESYNRRTFAQDTGVQVEFVHAIVSGAILLSALFGMVLRRRQMRADAILYAILLGFLAVSVIYFPATRLRAPMEFVLMFFSACALGRWFRRA